MTDRNFPAWAAGVLATALLITGCATASNANAQERIIAIGDLHGDYDAFEALLLDAGLINKRGRWTGGETILVQTGDVPDRGPESLKIIKRLQNLQKKAPRKGGKVITLVGNHEAMNVTGDLRYVHPGEYEAFADRNSRQRREAAYEANLEAIEAFYLEQDATFSSISIREKWFDATPLGKLEHQRAWAPDGDVGGWVANNPAVAIVGDSLFVHGGISTKYTAYSVNSMNVMTHEALNARDTAPTSILYDEMGPLWYRGHVRDVVDTQTTDPISEAPVDDEITAPTLLQTKEIDLALTVFDIDRIVIGHTPALSGITATHDGKIIQIDTGIAAYYGGTQSYLEIMDGVLIAHDNGVETLITDQEAEIKTP